MRREDLRRAVQLLVIAHSTQLRQAEHHDRVIRIEERLVDAVMSVVDKWESGGGGMALASASTGGGGAD
jgi:hypothetical protein